MPYGDKYPPSYLGLIGSAEELAIPGGRMIRCISACHGVTSVEDPLPVDQDMMFVLGSVTKTLYGGGADVSGLAGPGRAGSVAPR